MYAHYSLCKHFDFYLGNYNMLINMYAHYSLCKHFDFYLGNYNMLINIYAHYSLCKHFDFYLGNYNMLINMYAHYSLCIVILCKSFLISSKQIFCILYYMFLLSFESNCYIKSM